MLKKIREVQFRMAVFMMHDNDKPSVWDQVLHSHMLFGLFITLCSQTDLFYFILKPLAQVPKADLQNTEFVFVPHHSVYVPSMLQHQNLHVSAQIYWTCWLLLAYLQISCSQMAVADVYLMWHIHFALAHWWATGLWHPSIWLY